MTTAEPSEPILMLFLLYILYEKSISITGYGGEAICLIRVICGLSYKFTEDAQGVLVEDLFNVFL